MPAMQSTQQPPRFTPTTLGRYAECPSSYARELEVAWFAQDHGIAAGGSEPKPAILRDLAVRALVPDYLRSKEFAADLGLGPSEELRLNSLAAEVEKCAVRFLADTPAGLKAGGVVWRFAREGAVMLSVPLSGGAAEPLAGAPEILVTTKDAAGQDRAGLVVDLAASRIGLGMTADNPEMRAQAALATVAAPGLERVRVVLAGVTDKLRPEPPVCDFGAAELAAIREQIAGAMHRNLALADPLFESGEGTPAPAHAAQLDAAARPGDHCTLCTGKVACVALRQHVTVTAKTVVGEHLKVWTFFSRTLAELKTKAKASVGSGPLTLTPDQLKPMKLEDFSAASRTLDELGATIKLAGSLREDFNTITRQLVAGGVAVPGHAVRPGANLLKLATNKKDHELTPAEALAKIKTVIGPAWSAADQDAFLNRICSVSPAELRDYVALRLGNSPDAAAKQLADAGIVVSTPRAGTVVIEASAIRAAPAPVALPVASPPPPKPTAGKRR